MTRGDLVISTQLDHASKLTVKNKAGDFVAFFRGPSVKIKRGTMGIFLKIDEGEKDWMSLLVEGQVLHGLDVNRWKVIE